VVSSPSLAGERRARFYRAQRELTDETQKKTRQAIPWVVHRNGELIRDFRTAWKTARTNASLPGRIPHYFGRTAVRNLQRAGVSRSVAMKLIGHKTEAVY
jgi:hypothetical protein